MNRATKFTTALLALAIGFVGVPASEACLDKVERWELRTGYGYQYTNNSRPSNFQMISLLPSAIVPVAEWGDSPGWFHGRFDWNPELWIGMFQHPYDRPIIGITPAQFRYTFLTDCRLKPYVMGGVGVLYANVNRRETRSDWNFNPQVGLGFLAELNDRTNLILEYRHIHVSNAGLHEDNAGLNAHTFLVGVSVKN